MKIKGFLKKLIDIENPSENKSYDNFSERKRLMQAPKTLLQPKTVTTVYIVITVICMLCIAEMLQNLTALKINPDITSGQLFIKTKGLPLIVVIWKNKLIFIFLAILAVGIYLKFIYSIKASYASLNVGQKGTARWTTREELEEQYKKIPDKDETFTGKGGVIVGRDGNKLYIDDSTSHNLIIGTTRSGKGELEVLPMIDNLSRAEEKASLIINDPKLELAAASIPTLRKRGYDCHILNLIDPNISMGYNPLPVITEEIKSRKLDAAQQQCTSFAYTVFEVDENEKDKYFTDMARNVFIAAIIAQATDLIEADRKENEKAKFYFDFEERKRKKSEIDKLSQADRLLYLVKEAADIIHSHEPDLSGDALKQEIAEYIYEELSYEEFIAFRQIDNISAYIERDYPKINYNPRTFIKTNENEKKINLYSILNFVKILHGTKIGKNMTGLDVYFAERPENDFARIMYSDIASASEQTKGTIMSVFGRKTAIFGYESIAKMMAESTLDMLEIGFGKKPVAVFIGLPDYDKSNHFIGTVFIDQLYYTLSKYATAVGGKCFRRVVMLLDEFGNMPKLSNIESMISVGAGRDILFNFIIQSYSQLESKYGKEIADIIKDNCGNTVFILSANEETAQEFSNNLGKETITTVNRSGDVISFNKSYTEMQEEQPLLSAYELMHLKRGEMIVQRIIKRTDLKGENILATPIANMGKYRLKHRYEYLESSFPSGKILYRSPNMDRIITLNPEYKDKQFDFLEIDLETTEDINLKKISNSPGKYIRHSINLDTLLVDVIMPEALFKLFKLLNYSMDEMQKILQKDEDYQFTVRDFITYAESLISTKAFRARGYAILSILTELPDREIDYRISVTEDALIRSEEQNRISA